MDEEIKKTLDIKRLIRQVEKKYSLSGLEKGLLQVLVQSEINVSAGTTLGTHKALMNFKRRSRVRRAYEDFHRTKMGRVPWRD